MTIDEHGMACPDEVEYPDWEGEYRAQCTINSGLRRQVNDLKFQLAEAQKDRERLDWLEQRFVGKTGFKVGNATDEFTPVNGIVIAHGWPEFGEWHTIREALDAAMEAENGRA